MKLAYFPGCMIKGKGKQFDQPMVDSMAALGVELVDIRRYSCCGDAHKFVENDPKRHGPPLKNLVRAQDQGSKKLVTVCGICYNTSLQTAQFAKDHPGEIEILNTSIGKESDYKVDVQVVHFLEVLRDDVGWEAIAQKVKRPLAGLQAAAYYGCRLYHPAYVAREFQEKRTALWQLLKSIGGEPISFPDEAKCCESMHQKDDPKITLNRAEEIIHSASEKGAETIVASCPMCESALSIMQTKLKNKEGFAEMPIIYFTQLLALALGFDIDLSKSGHMLRTFLQQKGLVPRETS